MKLRQGKDEGRFFILAVRPEASIIRKLLGFTWEAKVGEEIENHCRQLISLMMLVNKVLH